MTREWVPGDVALVSSWRGKDKIAFRTQRGSSVGWVVLDGTDTRGLDDIEAGRVRPLATIDPESPEDVARLARIFVALRHSGINLFPLTHQRVTEALTDALREFATPTPPKPAEPTGLGAVVEDADGVRWVRAGHTLGFGREDGWRCTEGERVGWWAAWADIKAVRVLSEGVTS